MTARTETQAATELGPRPVAATVSRLTGILAAKSMTGFSAVGQSGPAREAGAIPPPAWDIIQKDPAGAGDADAGAIEELFRDAYPGLAGWVRRLVGDDGTAHEIASEAFVRLLSRWARVDSPRSYLYMIAANLIRDQWRKAERERRAIGSLAAGAEAGPVTWPAQDVDVRDLIASLPPRLRDPFLLHNYGGFRIREVAVLLRKPEGTIKADLFAARARLRSALGEHGR